MNDQKIAAIRVLLQNFARQELKIPTNEWNMIRIEKIVQDDKKDCDIIYVTFSTFQDIIKVNSNFKNLNDLSKNKIFQYVPNCLKKRYLAFESAAYHIQNEENHTVNTKISPGKKDFLLLVHKKMIRLHGARLTRHLSQLKLKLVLKLEFYPKKKEKKK